MREVSVTNWSGTVTTTPAVVVKPRTAQEVLAILADSASYPAPVRPIGNYHSTTACATGNGGTLIDTTAMNSVLEITDTHVTAQAGALYMNVARELAARGKNFFVDLQVGTVTLGSVATCDTKDGSYPGEYGQAGAYVTRLKLATAAGEIVTIDENDPALLQAVRSSYGLLGVVVEVTFRIRPLTPVSIRHVNLTIDEFLAQLPQLKARNGSMMMYLFPFADRVTVQLRGPGDPEAKRNRWLWWVRNMGVAYGVPLFARFARVIPFVWLRFWSQQCFYALARLILARILHARNTRPTDQATRYGHRPGLARFSFSIFAFSERTYPDTLLAYLRFVRDYYARTRYRPDLLTVGYRVAQSQYSLFSYSYDGDVMTIDPVGLGGAEWDRFIDAFNEFCRAHRGTPLFNQSPRLTAEQVADAFGERVAAFNAFRKRFDPSNRLLNRYFRSLLD